MPAYRVERSILIDADAETVFDTVADFSTWSTWSPWFVIAHEAVVTVTDDPKSVGSIYRWSGEFVGRGEIEHRQLDRPRKIVDTLRFEKPFKSTSQVEFSVQSEAGQTRLSWAMDGTLPWFLFWMRRNMETFIGMDYQRGLKMLREYIQTGRVLSKSTVEGIEKIPPRRVIGLRESCQLAEIGPVMEKTFARVGEDLRSRWGRVLATQYAVGRGDVERLPPQRHDAWPVRIHLRICRRSKRLTAGGARRVLDPGSQGVARQACRQLRKPWQCVEWCSPVCQLPKT
ncbi:Polyketide cyclase / dehydrase and lipid transport [Rosistilla carotiformis]|uniref:Polyketide cyclase / dehydrase and lipid transport n=1 Tax=Rosistilla carotiformis TaxID=2528017 RepID=A0A518JNL5_9BACT|nr:SRPBCC family protein [Rosistilla carotiformis]QDV67098.1 Polyketide cyclase / dehydrase and lipid transport [Rosistilla carotiformis]